MATGSRLLACGLALGVAACAGPRSDPASLPRAAPVSKPAPSPRPSPDGFTVEAFGPLPARAAAKRVARSIWGVVPNPPQRKRDLSPALIRGSAVAIGADTLLVSCRALGAEPRVGLVRHNKYRLATVAARDDQGDACVLRAPDAPLTVAGRYRPGHDLRPGEPVYALANRTSAELVVVEGHLIRMDETAATVRLATDLMLPQGVLSAVLVDGHGDLVGLARPGGAVGTAALAAPVTAALAPQVARRELGPAAARSAVTLATSPAAPPTPVVIPIAEDPASDHDEGGLGEATAERSAPGRTGAAGGDRGISASVTSSGEGVSARTEGNLGQPGDRGDTEAGRGGDGDDGSSGGQGASPAGEPAAANEGGQERHEISVKAGGATARVSVGAGVDVSAEASRADGNGTVDLGAGGAARPAVDSDGVSGGPDRTDGGGANDAGGDDRGARKTERAAAATADARPDGAGRSTAEVSAGARVDASAETSRAGGNDTVDPESGRTRSTAGVVSSGDQASGGLDDQGQPSARGSTEAGHGARGGNDGGGTLGSQEARQAGEPTGVSGGGQERPEAGGATARVSVGAGANVSAETSKVEGNGTVGLGAGGVARPAVDSDGASGGLGQTGGRGTNDAGDGGDRGARNAARTAAARAQATAANAAAAAVSAAATARASAARVADRVATAAGMASSGGRGSGKGGGKGGGRGR